MSVTFESSLTLHRSRTMLNADGLIEGGLVYDSFDVDEINTAARIAKDNLYFGEITNHGQLRTDATAHLIWNRDQAILTARFAWGQPASRLLIAADRQVPYEISAAFEGSVNALTVESRRHQTFVSFCRTVVDNGDVRFDPIGINWENADTVIQQAAKAKLVGDRQNSEWQNSALCTYSTRFVRTFCYTVGDV